MEFFEMIVFLASAYFTVLSLIKWYMHIYKAWPPNRGWASRIALGCLPPAAFIIITTTLVNYASYDVVESGFYMMFYILFGFAWIYGGQLLVFAVFDLSWQDDVLTMNNKAALFPTIGSYFALLFIYAGANIGDGPGWWCVLIAGGMGIVLWLALGYILSMLTGAFERITVARDIETGIRVGGYLAGSGIILARASAGDWTSLTDTFIEFLVGWPVLPLVAVACVVELAYVFAAKSGRKSGPLRLYSSILFGVLFIVISILIVALLPPMIENPMYG
jgi:hypothetical protein